MTLVLSMGAVHTTSASASFTKNVTATTAFGAHGLTAPTLSCGGGGLLSITLNWTAPTDTTQSDVYGTGFLADGYELARGTVSGGPYSSVRATVGLGTTSYNDSVSQGTFYYVVRSTKYQWRGAISNQRQVNGLLFLAATCS
jgi:hypothetical protein